MNGLTFMATSGKWQEGFGISISPTGEPMTLENRKIQVPAQALESVRARTEFRWIVARFKGFGMCLCGNSSERGSVSLERGTRVLAFDTYETRMIFNFLAAPELGQSRSLLRGWGRRDTSREVAMEFVNLCPAR